MKTAGTVPPQLLGALLRRVHCEAVLRFLCVAWSLLQTLAICCSATLARSVQAALLGMPNAKVSDMTPPMTPSRTTEQSVQPPSSQANSSSQVGVLGPQVMI